MCERLRGPGKSVAALDPKSCWGFRVLSVLDRVMQGLYISREYIGSYWGGVGVYEDCMWAYQD